MAKRDDLVPFDRHKARKWTRACDYVTGTDLQALSFAPKPDLPTTRQKVSRRGLWLPISVLGLAAAALWASGAFERGSQSNMANEGQVQAAAAASLIPAGATSSKGVVFGLCDQGGTTNCVIDGDSFYMGGKGVRIAGVDAPETHSAKCDAEALLGWAAAERLHAALNSGTVTMVPVEPGHDPNGRLLRRVLVDGQDVGEALAAAGLARRSDGSSASWC